MIEDYESIKKFEYFRIKWKTLKKCQRKEREKIKEDQRKEIEKIEKEQRIEREKFEKK